MRQQRHCDTSARRTSPRQSDRFLAASRSCSMRDIFLVFILLFFSPTRQGCCVELSLHSHEKPQQLFARSLGLRDRYCYHQFPQMHLFSSEIEANSCRCLNILLPRLVCNMARQHKCSPQEGRRARVTDPTGVCNDTRGTKPFATASPFSAGTTAVIQATSYGSGLA